MGAPYVPTNDPVVNQETGLMTDPWRRYQERLATAITPGSSNEVLTSNGTALVWKLLTNSNISAAAAIAWTKLSKAGSSLADLTTRSASDLNSGTLATGRGGSASSTYTPTLTAVANVAASTAYVCQYVQSADFVTVTGKLDIDPTAGATLTQIGISLPVASALTLPEQVGGTAASPVVSYFAAILADAVNDRAELQFTTAADVANRSWWFTFGYRVI